MKSEKYYEIVYSLVSSKDISQIGSRAFAGQWLCKDNW